MTPREHAAVSLHPAAETVVGFGPFRFDRGNGLLSRGGEELPLPPRALAVLSVLVERAGRVVSKHELLQVAWNGAYVTETSLSEAVSLLRQTLGDDSQRPIYIQTVHRRGYRFIAPLRVEEPAPRLAPQRLDDARPAPSPPAREPAAWPAAVLPLSLEAASAAAAAAPALAHREDAAPVVSRSRHVLRLVALGLGIAALVVAAVAGGFLAARRSAPRAATAAPTRFAFAPPGAWKLVAHRPSLAVSPDGRRIVFTAFTTAAGKNERNALFLRDLETLGSRELPGTSGAHAPFFSPDGRAVGYFADGQLRRVALAGGPPVTIAPAYGEGGSWGDDGTIVFASGRPTALFRVPAAGGKPQRLTTPKASTGEVEHWWPQLLPGSEAVIFTAWSTTLYDARVEWLSLRSGERRTLVVGGAAGRYADGRLLWARPDGTVVAAPFDPRSSRLLAEPAPLLADVVPHPFYAFAQLAVGGDTLVYLPGTATPMGERRLARLDGDAEQRLPIPSRFFRNLKTGPRGGRLAATLLVRDRSDVWVVDPQDGAMSRLTFDGFNIEPVWSPDGAWVAYASNRSGPFNVYRRRTDGSQPAERLLTSPHHQHPTSWSPDGREMMIGEVGDDTGFDLWVLDLQTRRPRPLLRTPANELYAVWSPDGRWFAYMSDEGGQYEIYVRSYPDMGGRWQISTDGGYGAFWSLDGRTLYFHHEGDVWAVPVAPSGRELHPGPARQVTHRDDIELGAPAPGAGIYAILEQRPSDAKETPPEVRLVSGWQATLPPLR
ncbi:MAG TPA: winged helix-turn-helix domain-containing protein [Thermoanaerobaculia bacterium]|jgi:serine/threonine-protein kinase|nr:winged helix-turn-helix domain-containing protein [Thermoanaerobaculia bacterium]